MNPEVKVARERDKKEAFLSCLINEHFPGNAADTVLIISSALNEKPLLDLVLRENVIKIGASKSKDRYGNYQYGLAKFYIHDSFTHPDQVFVDFYGPITAFPISVGKKLVTFDPSCYSLSSLRLLDLWSRKHKREIEEYEKAYLFQVFGEPKLVPQGENNDSGSRYSS